MEVTSSKITSTKKCSENRKIRKPLMEKKRRARINDSLNELRRLICETNDTDESNPGKARCAKLEKADILEMTVNHLQRLKANRLNQHSADSGTASCTTCSNSRCEDRGDYKKCMSDVCQLIEKYENINPSVKSRLSGYLLSNLVENRTVNNENVCRVNKIDGTPIIPVKLGNGEVAFLVPTDFSSINAGSLVKLPYNVQRQAGGSQQFGTMWRPWF